MQGMRLVTLSALLALATGAKPTPSSKWENRRQALVNRLPEASPKNLAIAGASFLAASAVGAYTHTRETSGPGKCRPIDKPGDGHILTAKGEKLLDKGKSVLFGDDTQSAEGGRGSAVCDVAAPPHLVWKTVLDFESYPSKCVSSG